MINISQIFFPLRLFVLLVLCSEQQNRCTLSNPDKTEFNTMQFSHLVGSKLTHYCLNGCRNVFEQNFACSQPIKIMIKWVFFPNTILIKVNWIVAMEAYALQRNQSSILRTQQLCQRINCLYQPILKKSRYYRVFEIRRSYQQNQ